MTHFTTRYADHITGVLSGFDRLLFRGTLRRIANLQGFGIYLHYKGILLKDFGDHAEETTAELKRQSFKRYEELGLPIEYLPSSHTSKEDVARALAAQRGITSGPICLLYCTEPCSTFSIYRNRESKHLELVARSSRCLHFYHYQFHPVVGFMHARIQSWFPFTMQVCMNGREWLARQMDAEGMSYERHGNCFAWVDDFAHAQELLDAQLRTDWPQLLNKIADTVNPIREELFRECPADYYWTTRQSEWASDIVFNDPQYLERLYPMFIRHAMSTLASPDILRYLGHYLPASGEVPKRFRGEATSDLKARPEGVRIKHTVNQNSVKLYDKLYTETAAVLRPETTINNAADLKVYRPKEGGAEDDLAWRPLRKGVADLYRRSQVSQRANERYLDAIASVDDSRTLGDVLKEVTAPATWNEKRVRALRPFAAEDMRLLQAVSRGEFVIVGLRNRDLQRLLFEGDPDTPRERKRRSAWVTRRIRMLRAHKILQKVGNTHRYQITSNGRAVLTAILTARDTPINRLVPEPMAMAA